MLQLDFLLPLLPWLIILIPWMILFILDSTIQLEKHGIEVGPFMLMARTQRFNNFLNRVGKWHPRAWRYIWSGFVGVCFIFSLFGFYYLIVNLTEFLRALFQVPDAAPGPIVPLVPGVTMSFSFFLVLLIPLIISIVVHEMAHGISARSDDIPVKSSGIFALLFLFGAFVEPDEEYVKTKTTRRVRARFFAAGSSANLGVALIAFILITALVVQAPQGVLIRDVVAGAPADGVLSPYTVITGMNDTVITNADDLGTFLDNAHPGDLVILIINGVQLNLTLGSSPANASSAYMGIYLTDYYPLIPPFQYLGPAINYGFILNMLWLYVISLSLAIMNLLPIPPLDGDRLYKELIDAAISLERTSGRVVLWGLRIFALVLLLLNIIFTVISPGLLLLFFG
ncbi:MAG: site-2 protease family protein [Promethearchaeota archaeon]